MGAGRALMRPTAAAGLRSVGDHTVAVLLLRLAQVLDQRVQDSY
jgi:hypothetical protein